jgi:hypothetical protein
MTKKLVLLLASAFLISSASANTLECEQFEGEETQGMIVKAIVLADINVNGDKDVELKNLDTTYEILDGYDDDYFWSKGQGVSESVSNYKHYNPRKYKGHMKFSYGVYGAIASGYGDLDLIVPAKELVSNQKGSTFTSYLIMTYMDDHFGGTISLNCSIK